MAAPARHACRSWEKRREQDHICRQVEPEVIETAIVGSGVAGLSAACFLPGRDDYRCTEAGGCYPLSERLVF
jgi:predicted NAD/FAD-binding protein